MWTIISLNGKICSHFNQWAYRIDTCIAFPAGTILHLQARKQRNKLSMFKKLYRILMVAVICVAVFFVLSTMALSTRGREGE